ncbi:hypothetical protein SAMN05444287_2928 [Octadecabacter temperatus]|uniref:Uncharacterized protein n=1 Tax=Octadecabacter temperatus TaxID=1458307 RepID=A0A0K0Y8Y5_9RHOB|nr:hypothetical protein [Octadecabacter temperatus]AKS47428.1 hypothetical protein OSB_29050 [Octadecabacter temperatus]SIO42801.1 hypothetical protein SAMN05444287_2928 [Octadecabacter temperatus]
MKTAPQLAEGEEVLHQHVPNLGAFKRTALLMLAITILPTVVILMQFPDTLWGVAPMFVTCLLLMQERFNLGKYAAWITNQRVLLQSDEEIALGDIAKTDTFGNAVRLHHKDSGQKTKLYYAKDRGALRQLIETARQGAA